MKSPRLRVLAIVTLALVAAACHSSMNTPEIKQNPNPKQRYEITLAVQDAPGPFESVEGFMGFDIDKDCAPVQAISGAQPGLGKVVPFVLEPVGANTYRGTVYLDLLQDADYFGLGVCHWHLTSAFARMKVGEVTFSPDLSNKEAVSGQLKTEYFPKLDYGDNEIKDRTVFSLPTDFVAARRVENFFSTTMTARESSK